MTHIVYGDGDAICAIGMMKSPKGDDYLPFFGMINTSSIVKDKITDLKSATDEDTRGVVQTIIDNGGVMIYFDNPESAQRFQKLLSVVFVAACDGDWAHRTETDNRSMN